jgi:RHS repeat-associated protein
MYRKVCCLLIFLFICSAFPSLIHADNQTVFGPKSFEIGKWHVHASVHTFNVEDPGEGVVTITKNTLDKPISGGFILFNTTAVPLRDFLTGGKIVLEKEITLRSINFITVFLMGTPGASVTITINSGGTPALPPEVSFSADPQTITLGESSALSWNVIDADTIRIDPGIGSVDPNGSYEVFPTETTTYTLTAVGAGGTTTESVTVSVNIPLPTVSISADPEAILLGESSILTWNSTHADTCVIEPNIGSVDVNASMSISPPETTTYTITVTGPGGTASADVTIFVTDLNAPPTVTMTPASASIPQDESITLTWNSQRGQSAFIDNGVGSAPLNGSTTVSPDHTTIYTITVTGPTGSNSAQAKIQVTGNPASLPEGSFGKQYEDLIPTDATVDEYDTKRFSLITGLVLSIDDSPISDVSVTLHGHPEYGTVPTDAQGRFSLPVEGGTTLTVVYQKDGFITSHRKVYVPWNDIAIAETIQMIAEDPVSTTITFDGNPDTVVTHRSTDVSDEFGSRSATMVFTGDNHAYLVDENGNDVHELTTITTRATEFTTPESMPAKLPPNSAYTYCAELSVDGAQRVRFEKPVITWVDNFLGFDVGEIVPVGYYDLDRGVWVPSDNGVVVKLLDTDSDGIVDALDADGDNQPNDLNNNGSFSDEVKGLDDAGGYQPDSTYWRVVVSHFTPWDTNWPYGPPANAISPNPKGPPKVGQQCVEDCQRQTGSFVEERARIFHEDIPIPGTGMTMHYKSNRVPGYINGIFVPASGDFVPPCLKRIIVRVKIAGKTLEQTLDPIPNQKAGFGWDGLDFLGREVANPTAHVSIGFVYNLLHYTAGGSNVLSFGQAGYDITLVGGRNEVIIWKFNSLVIQHTNREQIGTIAQGWTLSSHHYLTLNNASTLYKGDGSVVNDNVNVKNLLTRVAGGGVGTYCGDGGLATQACIWNPEGVNVDAAGNLYISDTTNHRIRKVDTDGIITTVAGGGSDSGDGIPATDARLSFPTGSVVDAAGNLYFSTDSRIRKVDINGIITTVAGGGNDYGDGIPAIEARLNNPYGITMDVAGNLYIADCYNHRVRKVDTNGIITTVAGNGTSGFTGDGSSAIEAQLDHPRNVAVDSVGNLYFSDSYNHRIRKVDVSGIITTVAGSGPAGSYLGEYSGDGGLANQARLSQPYGIALDSTGNLYIADTFNNRVRKVHTNGIITTVAGNLYGICTFGVCLDPLDNLYIADFDYHNIKKISFPSVLSEYITSGHVVFGEKRVGYIMNKSGRHHATIDLDTGITLYEFSYDENQNLVSVIDQFGNQTTINRDGSGVSTSITSPDGLTTQLSIDADYHLNRITYPDGSFYTFEYTPEGLMTAKIEPQGNQFDHTFNVTGQLADVTDEEGGHWNYTRSVYENGDILTEVTTGEGNVTSYIDHTDPIETYTSTITDPTGAETLFTRSADGLVVTKLLPCGMDLEFLYGIDYQYKLKYIKEMRESTLGGLQKVTTKSKSYQDTNGEGTPDLITDRVTVNGKITKIVHNTLLSQKTVASAEGRTITLNYDPSTLSTENMSISGLYDTSYGYDAKGRLTSVTTNTQQTAFTYTAQGFLESVTDPEGYTTTYTHDAVGRTTGISRPDGSSIGFTYDKNGNMTVLTNPSTIDYVFGYSKVNLNSSYQTPLSGSYSYVYDKDRRLKQINFPSGNQINNIYVNGRLEQIQTPERNIDFTYLCSTKVDSITNGTESITYGYDGKLVTSETLSGTLNLSLGYTYNDDFNLTSLTYAGVTESYTYDNDDLLTGAGSFAITRNAGNGLPETVAGGALSLSRSFSSYGEVDAQEYSIGGQNLTSWSLTRNDNGRITNKSETVGGTSSDYIYNYDAMGRLLTVTKDSTLVEEYQYDQNGTRIFEMNSLRGITARNFSYDSEDHLLTAGSVIYSYNLDGFLAAKTDGSDVATYDYSSRGELLSVMLPDDRIIEYVHDPLGRRIAKKINGVIVEKYLWQGLTRLLAVYDGSDNLLMRFKYADGRMPVAMSKGSYTYYLIYDQVGSLRVVADASGNVVKRIDYDSFGNIIDDTDPSFKVPFGFAGGLHDQDTGLVRFGYRDYDPDTGRWTAKDPILFAGGDTDLYGYCLNNPINLIDPDGLYLPNSQKLTVSAISGIASTIGIFVGGSAGGAAFGAIAGGLATLAMPCATVKDVLNNAATAALSGAFGGEITSLLKYSMMHAIRAASTSGLISGMTDAVLMRANPIVQ